MFIHDGIVCAEPTCPSGQFRNIQGACISCSSPNNVQVAKESDCLVCDNRLAQGSFCPLNTCLQNTIPQGNKCVCPDDRPLMAWNGQCFPCGTSVEVWQGEACSVCPDMVLSGRSCANTCKDGAVKKNGSCVCPPDKPLIDWDGKCHSCNESAEINVYANANACAVCDGSNGQAKRIIRRGTAYPFCVLAD